MSKEERYAEHTVAWELPNGDSVTKSNYNLAGIETKYTPIQTEVISDDKDKQVADLEAKLAEHNEYFRSFSCENFNEFQDFISTFMLTPHEEQTLIRELKQQLAEKEKEIEKLKLDNKKYFTDSCRANKEIAYKLKQQNQKALEQLEKVKELCKTKFEWWENSEWEGNIYDKSDVSNAYFDIEANIDQQIASLKKGVQ